MHNSPHAADARIGQWLPRGIELVQRVGQGAMAEVYRGVQSPLGRDVAVKIITPGAQDDGSMHERVLREASVASTLVHPNSVDIYDYGTTDDGQTYLVMEYLRGQDLATLLATQDGLPAERAIALMLQVLSALDEAHTLGIVHRDVKPENIFVEQRRRLGDFVKLVDFGLAKFIAGRGQQITAPNLVSGTPEYMAPEQARGGDVDGRADLYCVAVVLFEMLSGRRPFDSESPMEVMLMHLGKPAPRLDSSDSSGIPEGLVEIVARGMEKRPEDRFQTAREMAEALEQVLEQGRSLRPGKQSCRACGAQDVHGRFCGVCGAALPTSSAPNVITRRAVPALIGRTRERNWIREKSYATPGKFAAVELLGRPGVGKTALLCAAAEEFGGLGDRVIMSGPDIFGGAVSGHVYGEIISQCSMGTGTPNTPTSDASRVEGLRAALGLAAVGLGEKRLVIIVDDLDEIDALSRRALQGLVDTPPTAGVLLLTAAKQRTLRSRHPVFVREVAPLSNERARQIASPDALSRWPEATGFSPLALRHLEGFIAEGGDDAPSSLSELIAQRVTRTDSVAKRLLQLVATLRCPVPAKLLTDGQPERAAALERLERRGLVRTGKDGISVPHAFIAEVVRSGVPLGMRRGLEAQALEILTTLGAPIEARAWAARRAEAAGLGILLLEQVARRSEAVGDAFLAADAYQAIAELCRQDVGRGELDDPLAAEAGFVLRWADALRRSGRNNEAGAVLSETAARLPAEKAQALKEALGTSKTQPAIPKASPRPQRSNA